ncbi:MAG: FAD:protein FMN transferase [Thioalkalispiraceae bacterium]|jgi:thiamine biosynthesis lipoprotein
MEQSPLLSRHDDYWSAEFYAMASPCQLLMDLDDKQEANRLAYLAQQEALRIQNKFSRYLEDNIIFQINNSLGRPIKVDEETAALLDYADQCYEISSGLFDVTSGILREVWTFDCSDRIPGKKQVTRLLRKIGWDKVTWQNPYITLPEGMQIDLGGIGKEYAVDRTAMLLSQHSDKSVLVNYGGDLCATGERHNQQGWIVGVEDPANIQRQKDKKRNHSIEEFELIRGGIATSGDTRRFLLKDGIRYSHILDPRTGWPVECAPHSITVVANTCTEAGILATIAMLQGKHAESFLDDQGVTYWSYR